MPSLDHGSYSGADTTVTVAGWGVTTEDGSSPDVLHSVDLTLLTNAQCENYGYSGDLVDSMICAIGDLEGGEDSCQGDSGGPLFAQQVRALCAPPHSPHPPLQAPPTRRPPFHAPRATPPPPTPASPSTPASLRPLLGCAGGGGHHRRRGLVGLRLRTKGRRRRLHARVLLHSLDRGDERCGYSVPARAALPPFLATSAALAAGDAAAALSTSVGACRAFRGQRDR